MGKTLKTWEHIPLDPPYILSRKKNHGPFPQTFSGENREPPLISHPKILEPNPFSPQSGAKALIPNVTNMPEKWRHTSFSALQKFGTNPD